MLLLTPRFPPNGGGGAAVYGTYSQCLEEFSDIRLHILTESFRPWPMRRRPAAGTRRVYRLLPVRDNAESSIWGYKVFSFFWQYLVLTLVLPLLVASCGVRVLHYTRYYWPPFLLYLKILRRMTGIRLVADLRGPDQAIKYRFDLAAWDRLLVNSERTEREARRSLGAAAALHLLPTPFARPEKPGSTAIASGKPGEMIDLDHYKPYVAFCGLLSPNKNPEMLLEAFRLTQTYRRRGYCLLFAGQLRLNGFDRALGHHPRIHYFGSLRHQDSLAFIGGASLLVLPSRSEGVPRSCLEAIAMGVPVLVPPGIPEFDRFLPESVLPALTVEALASAIDRALETPRKAEYPFAINDPKAVTRKLVRHYRDLCRRVPGNAPLAREDELSTR